MSSTSPLPGQAGTLFHAGRLTEAVAAAGAAVKAAPQDLRARVLLAEMLAFAGNAERADVILDAAADVEPGAAVAVAEFRQLLRAEVARRQTFRDGRVPEFLGEPTTAQRHALSALVALRSGDAEGAAREAAAAEAARPHVHGMHGEQRFDDMRDADDLIGGSVEVLTTTGKYFWIPIERLREVQFHPPKRPRDLLWRRATMSVADGPEGEVYVPAIYAPAEGTSDDSLALGRSTDWIGPESGPVRGVGQRTFLLGEAAVSIMELGHLTFPAAG
ncbi:type VI secretion system accessory protein TagJ [Falsiroseomonas oryziterrae]|uniref:type VI secretion system accessory protein TagJ n=1 Tax=Falsiroseomonas oryziterrae TaxID=2911368 RepID=UPI001F2D0EF0|nr:type VI secretion system accessory protein TagJ [Roseomonas sp. NPKOSM-4]